MKFSKLFFITLLSILLGIIVLFFIAREVLLYLALYQVRSDASQMESLATKSKYEYQCLEMAEVSEITRAATTVQLRFTSSQEYVTESVCNYMRNQALILDTKQLPLFVKKKSGNSGIVLNENGAGVILEIFGRSGMVFIEDDIVKLSFFSSADKQLNIGPVTQCTGYGFVCCQDYSQQGQGEQLAGVKDCSEQCYSSCLPKPIVLSFNSDPFFNGGERTVKIKSGTKVTFSYVISEGDQLELNQNQSSWVTFINSLFEKKSKPEGSFKVSLDFGNGNIKELDTPEGTMETTYLCFSDNCSYIASLKVINEYGITNTGSSFGEIKILVQK